MRMAEMVVECERWDGECAEAMRAADYEALKAKGRSFLSEVVVNTRKVVEEEIRKIKS